jgi:hypothetical protein
MNKKYFIILTFLFFFSSCKEEDLPKGIFVTGDLTAVLNIWRGERNGMMNIANFADSARIAYPAFWLSINENYAALYYQAEASSNKIGYFALAPTIKQNSTKILELDNLKLIFARNIVAGVELIGADETKNVILNGKIQKK